MFIDDRERWYERSRFVATVAADADAAWFSVEGLPPGTYFIVAVDSVPRPDPNVEAYYAT